MIERKSKLIAIKDQRRKESHQDRQGTQRIIEWRKREREDGRTHTRPMQREGRGETEGKRGHRMKVKGKGTRGDPQE